MFPSMNKFDYERPHDLKGALSLISQFKKGSLNFVLSSGGTDLIPTLKNHDIQPGTFISLTDIEEIKGIHLENKTKLVIGAGTTLFELISDTNVKKTFPILADTAKKIASPQVRFRATVGGNLLVRNRCRYYNQSPTVRMAHGQCYKDGGKVCHLVKKRVPGSPLCRARSVSDLAPVFLLLDASLLLQSKGVSRKIPIRKFYQADGMSPNHIKPEEILSQIEITLPEPKNICYEKLRVRNAIDFPSLGVAVSLTKKKEDHCLGVALTGIDTLPLFLEFHDKDFANFEELLSEACIQAEKTPTILKQDFFPPAYQRKMIGVLIRKCFQSF